MTAPAAFLDRDGTLIPDRGFLGDPAGVELLEGTVEALRTLRDAGFRVVAVTNQSGISRGLISWEGYRAVIEPAPARPGGHVEFEIAVAAPHPDGRLEGLDGERGAPKVGVEDHAGGVDDREERRGAAVGDPLGDLSHPVDRQVGLGTTGGVHRVPDRSHDQIAGARLEEAGYFRQCEQPVDRRQLAPPVGHRGTLRAALAVSPLALVVSDLAFVLSPLALVESGGGFSSGTWMPRMPRPATPLTERTPSNSTA